MFKKRSLEMFIMFIVLIVLPRTTINNKSWNDN